MLNPKLNTSYDKKVKELLLHILMHGERNAISGAELMSMTGLSRRRLKEFISDLRTEVPICSKETDGGGYWIADSIQEITDFINMIMARQAGYIRTVTKMRARMLDMLNKDIRDEQI